jgi:hypothetical protein
LRPFALLVGRAVDGSSRLRLGFPWRRGLEGRLLRRSLRERRPRRIRQICNRLRMQNRGKDRDTQHGREFQNGGRVFQKGHVFNRLEDNSTIQDVPCY